MADINLHLARQKSIWEDVITSDVTITEGDDYIAICIQIFRNGRITADSVNFFIDKESDLIPNLHNAIVNFRQAHPDLLEERKNEDRNQ